MMSKKMAELEDDFREFKAHTERRFVSLDMSIRAYRLEEDQRHEERIRRYDELKNLLLSLIQKSSSSSPASRPITTKISTKEDKDEQGKEEKGVVNYFEVGTDEQDNSCSVLNDVGGIVYGKGLSKEPLCRSNLNVYLQFHVDRLETAEAWLLCGRQNREGVPTVLQRAGVCLTECGLDPKRGANRDQHSRDQRGRWFFKGWGIVMIPHRRPTAIGQRTGDSRGFAFVRYKYADEAQKAVEKLDGRVVDGREIMVQFAKYGPDAERIHKGRILEPAEKLKGRSRSRSPRPSSRHRDDYRDRDRRRNRSRSRDRSDYDRPRGRDRDRYRSRSRSRSPDYRRERRRSRYDDDEKVRSRSPIRSASPPARRSGSPRKSASPRKSPSRSRSPVASVEKERSATPKSVSPPGRADSRSPSPQRSDADHPIFVNAQPSMYAVIDAKSAVADLKPKPVTSE
ncbi:serine/arginine-rich splicing factor SC35-like protein [Tanacetum coccineum]